MTIEIKPAEIVGASIGDRVSWSHGRSPGAARYIGRLEGLTMDEEHILLVIKDENGEVRRVSPETVRVEPKKYAVGDEVGGEDFPHLPNGTVLLREKYLPAFKANGTWYVIDHGVPSGTREIGVLYERTRTIAWMPQSYTNR